MPLLAISDLHVSHAANRRVLDGLLPVTAADWLIVAGDVGERANDVLAALALLAGRFARVLWAPGNHELWTTPSDPVRLRGEARYRYLVQGCRELGVVTPEDPYPVWHGSGRPVVVAPLFLLYDYSFAAATAHGRRAALARAYHRSIVCNDEFLLHPDPYPSRESWCAERVLRTERRLRAIDPELPTVLVNHFPLLQAPTGRLRHPEFAQWCGTRRTANWHVRFRAVAMVYGHLHIPRTSQYDGVPFSEVSLGYPREWQRAGHPGGAARIILP
ncbi:metallophosphoesterase family protein [Streptomyces boninensis]|uniref:metallophosphoesterase family protein n=1 Tax=Streptomyces boninensis TaxID=2039455 RepID=UPI003B217FAA